jgi:hypothetical protein
MISDYINYCINALPETLAKHQLLRTQPQQVMQSAPATAANIEADTQPPSPAE